MGRILILVGVVAVVVAVIVYLGPAAVGELKNKKTRAAVLKGAAVLVLSGIVALSTIYLLGGIS